MKKSKLQSKQKVGEQSPNTTSELSKLPLDELNKISGGPYKYTWGDGYH